jgi:excinuclease ABC subunit C
MKMCLAPCYQGCTDERYAEEGAAVESFFATRGESRLVKLRAERDAASANLEFESAAALHAQVQKVEAVRALAPELVRPMSKLRAVILQESASADKVAVFLFENGRLRGPEAFSTIGMRIQNEQSGSSSLFAQPMALEPVPESGVASPGSAKAARGVLEMRMETVLAKLEKQCEEPTATSRQGHIALLKRWYYRPEAKRSGEIFFPDAEEHWPVKAILRGVGRVAAKQVSEKPAAAKSVAADRFPQDGRPVSLTLEDQET